MLFLSRKTVSSARTPSGRRSCVGTHREREVPEEPLRARLDQPAEALAPRLAPELELRRIVRDDDPRQLAGPARRLPEVRCEDGLRRDLVVAEEAVGRFELRIIERLGKALPGRSARRSTSSPSRRPNLASPRLASASSSERRAAVGRSARHAARDHARRSRARRSVGSLEPVLAPSYIDAIQRRIASTARSSTCLVPSGGICSSPRFDISSIMRLSSGAPGRNASGAPVDRAGQSSTRLR